MFQFYFIIFLGKTHFRNVYQLPYNEIQISEKPGFFCSPKPGGTSYGTLLIQGIQKVLAHLPLELGFFLFHTQQERYINLICRKRCLYGRSQMLSGRSGFHCAVWQGMEGATATIKAAKKNNLFYQHVK